MRRLSALVALVLFATLSTAVPAHAAGGAVRSADGVLWQCHDHQYRYQINLPDDAYGWSAEVTVTGPDGLEVTSDHLWDDDPTASTSSFQLCSSNLPGRYTISTVVEWYDYDYNGSSFSLPDATFTMRKPRSRTGIASNRAKAPRGAVLRLRVRSKDERPRGYFGTSYARVRLEVKAGKKWRRLSQAMTNDRGIATFRVRHPGRPMAFRARTLRTSSIAGSVSKVVRVR